MAGATYGDPSLHTHSLEALLPIPSGLLLFSSTPLSVHTHTRLLLTVAVGGKLHC